MLDTRIIDGEGRGLVAGVHEFKDKSHGLVVATRNYNFYEFKRYPFISEDYGENMAITISYGASPDNVHNGIDNTYWTGSSIVGTAPTFNSTAQAHTGTRSILWNNPVESSIFQIAKGSTFNPSGYTAITLWIYISSNWDSLDSVSIYAWDTGTNLQVGNAVLLQTYCNINTYGVWQQITISLQDMNLTTYTFTALRFKNVTRSGPKAPTLYLDDIKIEQTGSALGFYYAIPLMQTKYFCDELFFFMSDVYDSTQSSGTMPKLDPSKFIGINKLNNGITFQVLRRNTIRYNINFKCLSDLLGYGAEIVNYGYSGTETWMTLRLRFYHPIVLQAELEDYMKITISDTTSSLTGFTIVSRGAIEYSTMTDIGQKNVY